MDLVGWDTVSVVAISHVNTILAGAAGVIRSVDLTGDNLGVAFRAQLSFGAWRIAPGGSGELLRLELPIAHGAISAGSSTVALGGLTAVFDVSLALLATRPATRELAFDVRAAGKLGDAPAAGTVTPLALIGDAGRLDQLGAIARGNVLDGIARELARRAAELRHVFAVVNLVPPGAASWLAPVELAYGYFEAGSPAHGHLAIFAATSARDVRRIPRTIDPALVAGSSQAAFAISRDLFLSRVVMPLLPVAFDAPADKFRYDPADGAIVNTGRFGTRSVKAGAIRYHPKVASLAVHAAGDGLAIKVSGDCDLKAGISMTWWVTAAPTLRFDPAMQQLRFEPDRHPSSGHDADIPWYWKWLAPIVGDITKLVVSLIADSVAGTLTNELGRSGLAAAPAQVVHWAGMRRLSVHQISWNGSLILHGDLD